MIADRWRKRRGIAVVLACLLGTRIVSALNESTHTLVNQMAAQYEGLDALLQGSLGLRDGRATLLRGRTIVGWLGEGGAREDDGIRFLRHFHDPLKESWDLSGLGAVFASSVQWMQQPHQEGLLYPSWSWSDARRLYLQALTASEARRREEAAADLFRALGQVMHLVVDASVPEHSRNDQHLGGFVERQIFRNARYANYEYWVSDQHTRGTTPQARALSEAQFAAFYLSAPMGFDPSILQTPTLDGVATVPIAGLIDTRIYRRIDSPNVTLWPAPDRPAVGLAEFSNANFFSQNTLRNEYRYPVSENLPRSVWTTPSGRVRAYFAKRPGDGLAVDPARAECITEQMVVRIQVPYPCQDENVWRQAAFHMLPRAVGYARGVLDYFFRGSLRVRRVYAHAGGTFIDIENLADEELEGVFELFARPDSGTTDERRAKSGAVNHGAPTSIAPGATVTLPVMLLSSAHPTAAQLLVFRGRLGLEEGAVAGQVFNVPHVAIVQTGNTVEMAESCTSSAPQENRHIERCEWRPSPHIIDGELLTDPTVPVIARVSARSPLAGSVSLELDGVPIVGDIWRRQGDERDPRRFRLALTGNPHGLTLSVELVNGAVVSTPMVTLIMAMSSAHKSYTIPKFGFPSWDPPWIVQAWRATHLRVTLNPSYRALSISGFPNPTNVVADRFSLPAFREETIVRTIGLEASYFQEWVDYLHVYTTAPQGGPLLLLPILKAEFEALAFGPPPVVPWEAEMERIYEPGELEMLKTFVTVVPPPQRFTLAGRRRAGT